MSTHCTTSVCGSSCGVSCFTGCTVCGLPDLEEVLAWNKKMLDLVAETKTSPPKASRIYAYVSVAIEQALLEVPDELDDVAQAMLAFFFPDQVAEPVELSSEAQAIVDALTERALGDGADAVWTGSVPVGKGFWTGVNPLLPLWGEVKPWFLSSGSALRAPAPPDFDSTEFLDALDEVREISDARTAKQLAIAKFWADGPGTSTPPGHWNQIASEILLEEQADVLFAAKLLSIMNRAMADAAICCWDNKYAYWLIRPSQADPAITTPVGLPNFPSYTSGHSTFSATAATVIGGLVPDRADEVWQMAEEAALSRLFAGIHYRFDNDQGLAGGRKIGELALEESSEE